MPRKGPAPAPRAHARPDLPVGLVTQLVNKVLQRGKRTVAERIVYDALDDRRAEDRLRADRHAQAGRRQRQAAARGQEPPRRWRHLPGARSRSGPAGPTPSPSAGSSATPASAARRPWPSASPTSCSTPSNGIGASVKRREDMHKMAESNKAFAHYRW